MKEIIKWVLPPEMLEFYEIEDVKELGETLEVVLKEKKTPPETASAKGVKVVQKGYSKITLEDFPLRGRKMLLTVYRRKWQIESPDGTRKIVMRDLKTKQDGTTLVKEFADFLKEEDRTETDRYCYSSETESVK